VRKIALFLSGLLIAATAYAVTTGGFPSRPIFQSVSVGTPAASGTSKIVANNGGSGDTGVVAQTVTAGDAYFLATPAGVTNWSTGTRRSDGAYVWSNAVGLGTVKGLLTTSGDLTSFRHVETGTFTNNPGLTQGFSLADASPSIFFNENDQSAGNRWWGMQANNGIFNLQYCPDNISGCTIAWSVDRSTGIFSANFAIAAANITTGSWSATLSGCTTSPSATMNYSVSGNVVSVWSSSPNSCTSNSTSFSISGLPAAIWLSSGSRDIPVGGVLIDNGGNGFYGSVQITAGSGTITFNRATTTFYSNTGFTASGTKGFNGAISFTYSR